MAEKIEMSKITTDINEVYNDSGKYVTFDEQGNSIDDGRGVTAQIHQNADAVQYALITDPLNKPDDKYVNIFETGKIAHNITASGATYAIPNKSNVTQTNIEDDEKYECRDNVNTIEAGNVKVAHNTTESGVAYAVPNKSGAKPHNVVADEDDDKYMMIDQTEGVTDDYAVPDPDGGQIYNAYENLDPIGEGTLSRLEPKPEQSQSKGKSKT